MSSGVPWVWPPVAPPLSAAAAFAPALPGGSFMVRVANPGTSDILAAPPAGYMNLAIFSGHNADAANTLVFRVHDADGDQCENGGTPLAAGSDAFPASSGFPLITTSALTAVVSGGTGGTPCEFRGSYTQVQVPAGMLRATLALTNAYQAIAVVPASGTAVGYRIVSGYESANQGIIIFNGDTANCTPQFRLTRGALVFTWNAPITGFGSRSAPGPVVPLIPGDVFECKLAVAPAVPGSILLRAIFVMQ